MNLMERRDYPRAKREAGVAGRLSRGEARSVASGPETLDGRPDVREVTAHTEREPHQHRDEPREGRGFAHRQDCVERRPPPDRQQSGDDGHWPEEQTRRYG